MRYSRNGISRHISLVEGWLFKNKISSFTITEQLCSKIYADIYCEKEKLPKKRSDRAYIVKRQLSYIRQTLIRIKHKNKLELPEGFVYLLQHPKMYGIKVGSTIDVDDRLRQYNTGCPFRDYRILGYVFSSDRGELEDLIHQKLAKHRLSGEWFDIPSTTIKALLAKLGIAADLYSA